MCIKIATNCTIAYWLFRSPIQASPQAAVALVALATMAHNHQKGMAVSGVHVQMAEVQLGALRAPEVQLPLHHSGTHPPPQQQVVRGALGRQLVVVATAMVWGMRMKMRASWRRAETSCTCSVLSRRYTCQACVKTWACQLPQPPSSL